MIKYPFLMICLFIFFASSWSCNTISPIDTGSILSEAIIIDHTCTSISEIPEHWIQKAKAEFGIAYGHTSHGSQIISGMRALNTKSKLYAFDSFGGNKTLTISDQELRGDLGNPNRTSWADRTRKLLRAWEDTFNLIIWSWCGQVSSASEEDINTYLHLMDQLEREFPGVVFVYMTGHLDGSGVYGNLNLRNNQIRDFCKRNKKILFDFADIESYDPEGNSYLDKNANDNCDYRENGMRKNWANEWCESNPGECSQYPCAHSKSLNCDLKAKAFWWMLARIAGWKHGS